MKDVKRKIKDFIYNETLGPLISTSVCGIILFLIFFVIDYFFNKEKSFSSLNIQNFILLITFIAITWYSIETKLLKNATNIANAIQAEPFLVLQYRITDGKEELFIVNYGKGPAFNIGMEIENIQSFFKFSLTNGNPLGYLEKKILIPEKTVNNQDVEAAITLFFDKCEGDKIVMRKRKYRVRKIPNGWQINLLG